MNKEEILSEEGKIIYDLTNIFINKNQELEKYKNIIDKATNHLLDKYVTGKLDDEEVNNVVKILKGDGN